MSYDTPDHNPQDDTPLEKTPPLIRYIDAMERNTAALERVAQLLEDGANPADVRFPVIGEPFIMSDSDIAAAIMASREAPQPQSAGSRAQLLSDAAFGATPPPTPPQVPRPTPSRPGDAGAARWVIQSGDGRIVGASSSIPGTRLRIIASMDDDAHLGTDAIDGVLLMVEDHRGQRRALQVVG